MFGRSSLQLVHRYSAGQLGQPLQPVLVRLLFSPATLDPSSDRTAVEPRWHRPCWRSWQVQLRLPFAFATNAQLTLVAVSTQLHWAGTFWQGPNLKDLVILQA